MRALVSVNDKTGVAEFGAGLAALGWEIVSTGQTAAALRAAGIAATDVAAVTGLAEMLDGRVKTLHPAIHGGILARRDDPQHMAQLAAAGIAPIDLVACNLYDFAGTVAQPGISPAAAIEQIDIGGVALLRAAAKNYGDVTVVCRPADYPRVLAELRATGTTTAATRLDLAAAAFAHTANYDALIARYLADLNGDEFPEQLSIPLTRLSRPRYGENPHQRAAFYRWLAPAPRALAFQGQDRDASGQDHSHSVRALAFQGQDRDASGQDHSRSVRALAFQGQDRADQGQDRADQGQDRATIADAQDLHGKELGFNNLVDLDAALNIVRDFAGPAACVVKHAGPCGVATADSLAPAFARALAGDPVSAFGGIVGLNRPVDLATATAIRAAHFDGVIAPVFDADALALLAKRKSLILVATGQPIAPDQAAGGFGMLEARRVSGGLLLQTPDAVPLDQVGRRVVTDRAPTPTELEDLLFAWQVVKFVKSNAIVLASGRATVGLCGGQPNRVDAIRVAAMRAGERARGSVLASDAYLPFADNIDAAVAAGATAIIQPGGSVRDPEVIAAANAQGLAMVFTGLRAFRH